MTVAVCCWLGPATHGVPFQGRPTASGVGCTLLTDVAIVEPERGSATPDMGVVICGDRIIAVGPAGSLAVPPEAARISLPGRFVASGLVDMHVHLRTAPQRLGVQYLAAGVTTVRDMNGRQAVLDFRQAVRTGEAIGPTIYAAGPTIANVSSPRDGFPTPDTAEEAVQRVVQFRREGYDFIKVYTFLPRLPFLALLREARARGIPVVGHVPATVTLGEALAGGVSSIEHLTGYMDAAMTPEARTLDAADFRSVFHAGELAPSSLRRAAEDTAAAGVANCPTIVWFDRFLPAPVAARAWDDPALRAQGARNRRLIVRELARAGATVLVGSDSGDGVPASTLHDELTALLDAGFSRSEVLRMATSGAAAFLNGESEFGRVAPSMRADLLVLRCNPLDDLSCLRTPERVVVRGRLTTPGGLPDR